MSRIALSGSTSEALQILATAIRTGRLSRRWTVQDLAERVGVSHATITAVEAGRPGVAVGTVFEAATLVGVPLFSVSPSERSIYHALKRSELALLPKTVRTVEIDDDF